MVRSVIRILRQVISIVPFFDIYIISWDRVEVLSLSGHSLDFLGVISDGRSQQFLIRELWRRTRRQQIRTLFRAGKLFLDGRQPFQSILLPICPGSFLSEVSHFLDVENDTDSAGLFLNLFEDVHELLASIANCFRAFEAIRESCLGFGIDLKRLIVVDGGLAVPRVHISTNATFGRKLRPQNNFISSALDSFYEIVFLLRFVIHKILKRIYFK